MTRITVSAPVCRECVIVSNHDPAHTQVVSQNGIPRPCCAKIGLTSFSIPKHVGDMNTLIEHMLEALLSKVSLRPIPLSNAKDMPSVVPRHITKRIPNSKVASTPAVWT